MTTLSFESFGKFRTCIQKIAYVSVYPNLKKLIECEKMRITKNWNTSKFTKTKTSFILEWLETGIQINILLSNILQQYIDIANINININIGFSKIAISILNYCWQYIANFEQYIAEIEQYIAHFLIDEKNF